MKDMNMFLDHDTFYCLYIRSVPKKLVIIFYILKKIVIVF